MDNKIDLFYGFRKDKKLKVTKYVVDNIKSAIILGSNILNFITDDCANRMDYIFDNITLVNPYDIPTIASLNKYKNYITSDKNSIIIWNSLLYKSLGNIEVYKHFRFNHMLDFEEAYVHYRGKGGFSFIIDLNNKDLCFNNLFTKNNNSFKFNNIFKNRDHFLEFIESEIRSIDVNNKYKEITADNLDKIYDRLKNDLSSLYSKIYEEYNIELVNININYKVNILDKSNKRLNTINCTRFF